MVLFKCANTGEKKEKERKKRKEKKKQVNITKQYFCIKVFFKYCLVLANYWNLGTLL